MMIRLAAIFAVALLAGCAPLINAAAPTDCYDATSGSISLNGAVIRAAETVRFCPPSIRKVPSGSAAASAPAV